MSNTSLNNPELSNATRRSTVENLSNVKDSVAELVHGEKERVQNVWARGKEKALASEKRLEHYVSENPVKSVMIAVGTGVALGWILGRKR
ncbi:MAG: DUF883 family protein [Planctomycetes bacterium]|nr:DUF883 family protein [Planctomycetota bacterium]